MRVEAKRLRRLAILFTPLLALAGCSAFEPDPVQCPPITILPDAAHLERYIGGGSDLIDVAFEANLESVTPVCTRNDKDFIIDLSVAISSRRGPAMQGDTADFAYFVAITSADQQLLARQEFPVSIPVPEQGRRVRLTELVQPTIPLTKTESQFSYRVFLGFVLTREEIQRNRGG